MSRLMLCGVVAWLTLSSSAPVRADDVEDKVIALVEKLGGTITRDDKQPGKPVVGADLRGTRVSGTDLQALAPPST
jgi:internalin A